MLETLAMEGNWGGSVDVDDDNDSEDIDLYDEASNMMVTSLVVLVKLAMNDLTSFKIGKSFMTPLTEENVWMIAFRNRLISSQNSFLVVCEGLFLMVISLVLSLLVMSIDDTHTLVNSLTLVATVWLLD